MSSVLTGVLNELKLDVEVPQNVLHLLEKKFKNVESLFSGLSTVYQQRKYLKEKFHKIVSTCTYTTLHKMIQYLVYICFHLRAT